MSKFYGQVIGAAKTTASRRGHSSITTSAQSFDGSIITSLYYKGDDLMIIIEHNDGSACYGEKIFNGTVNEFISKLRG